MPEFQPIVSARIAAIQRPGCPTCGNRMLLSKLEVGQPGFDKGTFECQQCGGSVTRAVPRDGAVPAKRGWLGS